MNTTDNTMIFDAIWVLMFVGLPILLIVGLVTLLDKANNVENEQITDCIERGNEVSWCLEVI